MSSIYKIENILNGKIYIGQTRKTIEERFNEHVNLSERSSYHIHRAIKKHGAENFRCTLIETADEMFINEREIFWINNFDSYKHGYNMTLGGEGKKGYCSTKETKEKISKSKKGTPSSKAGYIKRNETLKKTDHNFLKTIGRKSSITQKANGLNAGKNNPRFDSGYYLLFDNFGNKVLRCQLIDLKEVNPLDYPVRTMNNTKRRNSRMFLGFKEHRFKNWQFCSESELYVLI